MPDQTPVTDDDRRKAHEWAHMAADNDHDPHDAPWRVAARLFLSHVPDPPATLADQIVRIARAYGSPVEEDFLHLADRVEDVERARKNLVHNCDVLLDKHQKAVNERDDARTEVERLRKELGEERGKVHESSQIEDEAVSLSYWLADNLSEHVDDQDNETLTATVRRFVKQETGKITSGRTAPGVNPADVRDGEAWLVDVNGVRNVGVRVDGYKRKPWLISHPTGDWGFHKDSEIALVSRLVPEVSK